MGKQATARLKHVDALIMEREAKILAKLADGAIGVARVVDKTVVNTINLITDVIPNLRLVPEDGVAQQINPHFLEDLTKGALSKFEGLNIVGGGVPKGTGNTSKAADITKGGSHFLDEFKLKPNMKYETNEYKYETDDLGRVERASGELKLEMGERNGKHQLAAGGEDRVKAPSTKGDHGGHLIGTQFNGSPLIDNIVAMNVSAYKKLENTWAKALREEQQVLVDIKPIYEGQSLRPSRFEIKFKIDGKKSLEVLENIYGGK